MQVIKDLFILYPEKDSFSSNTYLLIGHKPTIIDPGNHAKEYLKKFLDKPFKEVVKFVVDIEKEVMYKINLQRKGLNKQFFRVDLIVKDKNIVVKKKHLS